MQLSLFHLVSSICTKINPPKRMLRPWKCVANNDAFDLHLSQVMSPLVSPEA